MHECFLASNAHVFDSLVMMDTAQGARWQASLAKLVPVTLRPKTPSTLCSANCRPAKPPREILCAFGEFVPDPAAVNPLPCSNTSGPAVRGPWKVSDAEDNEVTCLRCRRRGARNRSGQACRQTSHGCESCCCGYGAGAAATPSAVQRQPHHAIDATSQRLITKRCRSHRQRAAKRSSARRFG